ncbi:hypothetical protein [Burkholderia ubonensis]|uniref:Uncharacterized protein n=1 Tax=Burkholderia ubonensis subsp. mesacidophila TaxID=265293 RepID=A0A2A4FJ58_9BURK|nr:hypothetical protein [Burkholderia ubonensis]PCE32644.1 hypothetical protein BZL54_08310 [Burkholderia ubonensis subsp. mesacidophila]
MTLIGYHATRSGHRASLSAGVKQVTHGWNPASGGALGYGFYVIVGLSKPRALYLTGYGVATAVHPPESVDIWEVWCDTDLDRLAACAVPAGRQWSRITSDLCEDYDWLSHASERPPMEIKFNPRAYPRLRVRLNETLCVAEAEHRAFE